MDLAAFAHPFESIVRELDALSMKYRGFVPAEHRFPYVAWWFARWHANREVCVNRYISNHVVWC